MNWKLLFAGTMMTCVVLLSTGDCSALELKARRPAGDHPALTLDSGLWRTGFLTKKGNLQSSDADALLSAPTESPLSSSRAPTRERESSFAVPSDAPGISLFVEMPVVDVAEVMLPDLSGDLLEISNDPESAAGDATLSDWQQAAAVSVGRKGKTLNSNGPSLLSLVVGVVGLIVIVGTYMTSGKKK